MPVVMKMPTILEDETVFIRHAGELRFPDVRERVLEKLAFRFQNEMNHVQFMGGYGKAHHGDAGFVEDNRWVLMEWERQGRRVKNLGMELSDLGVNPQELVDEATYTLDGGRYKQPLFKTVIDDWEDMLVWRWLRSKAWSYRSMTEFGSVYVPLSQFAFDQYFDLGLTRWPADTNKEDANRLRRIYHSGLHDQLVASIQKWYPLARDFVTAASEHEEESIHLRVCTRTVSQVQTLFIQNIREDLRDIGLSPSVV